MTVPLGFNSVFKMFYSVITIAESINTLSVEKINSRVATKLHYFSIFFYNKRQKLNNSGNTFHSCSFVNACTQAAMLGACKSV